MEGCHQFLDLVPKEMKKWVVKKEEDGCPEEKKLELRLGPPTGDWSIVHESVTKEPSQPCKNRATDNRGHTNVPSTSTAHKRTASGPVAGWPPVRSFRKNLATGNSSNSSKLPSESADAIPDKTSDKKPVQKSQFVKINMDGILIGRKVDLKAYDSYEKLSFAVDELFRGLIAVQRDSSASGIEEGGDGGEMGRLVNENGEYTLVYEDNEGDRMLVGDVPWNMFVSTVKRLRVLRSSELPALSRELSLRQGK